MARLKSNLAKGRGSKQWEDYDKEIAYGVFIVEKEFHVGIIKWLGIGSIILGITLLI